MMASHSALLLYLALNSAFALSSSKLVVVGATGGTGLRALRGLLDMGYKPADIRLLTRNPARHRHLSDMGFCLHEVDLDDGPSDALKESFVDCVGCYIHSTSSDTRKLDRAEEDRARVLAQAMTATGKPPCHVVYNSAAGEPNHGVDRIQQKQDVEQIFRIEFPWIPFTSLRANLFMEELWKGYTRPAIIKGKFPFATPPDRKIYLTSVRDMGRIAGSCLQEKTEIGSTLNVASDVLTASEVAASFARAQESPCRHSNAKVMGFLSQLFFRDLYQVIRFYRRSTEITDIPHLKSIFPGLLTDFDTFLNETHWKDRDLTFYNFTSVLLSN